MTPEEVELLKNPAFIIFAVVFFASIILIRNYFINKSRNNKYKLIGFFWIFPVRESIYDLLPIVFGAIWFIATAILISLFVKEPDKINNPQYIKDSLKIFLTPAILFFYSLYKLRIYRKTKAIKPNR